MRVGNPNGGGQIELWSRDMTRKVRSYDPTFGRLVVFSTGSDTFHGHPDPMALPNTVTRKSIALYYYTNSDFEIQPMDEHTTIYRPRPDEVFRRADPKSGAKVKKEKIKKVKRTKPVKSRILSLLSRLLKWVNQLR